MAALEGDQQYSEALGTAVVTSGPSSRRRFRRSCSSMRWSLAITARDEACARSSQNISTITMSARRPQPGPARTRAYEDRDFNTPL